MRRMARAALAAVVCSVTSFLIFTPSASAVPSYSREYGVQCGGCHTMWGSLNVAGATCMLVPGAPVTDVGKRQTFWMEYHLGVANGSNSRSDSNASKGVYGRYVRWYNQSLGGFAFYASDISSDEQRTTAVAFPDLGGRTVIDTARFTNATVRAGPDATLSLAPFGIPVSLENEVLYNRESDPTGFGREFVGQIHRI